MKKKSRLSVIFKQVKVFVVFPVFSMPYSITPTFHHGPEKFSCFRFRQVLVLMLFISCFFHMCCDDWRRKNIQLTLN